MFAARQPPLAAPDALSRLTWQDFEHLLAEHYRDQGYHVEHIAPAASLSALSALSAGMDLRLRRGSESVIVQCKHWDAEEVEIADVNELLGNMLNEAATRGVFVTRGRFSAEARAVMRRQPRLQLVDGDILRVMLKLPDHLDISLPGSPQAKAAARRTARDAKADARRHAPRRRSSGTTSMVGPALLGGTLVLLLGVFVWHAMSSRHEAEAGLSASAADTAPPAPAAVPRPIASLPPAPPETTAATGAPLSGASGIVASRAAPLSLDPPSASRELAERERLRQQTEDARATHKHEDAMKVLEQNTRELGSHE